VTASLGRVLIDSQRAYQKPMRWFEIGQCFRYEAPQAGRTREFYQFNVDLIGEADPAADAELIALTIELMREFGFRKGDFVIRLSDRRYWQNFANSRGLNEDQAEELLSIVDKLSLEEVEDAIKSPSQLSEDLNTVLANLEDRGMREDVEVDLSIVRGLAYYTGVVFEVFDAKKKKRAVAGGGRYDKLVSALSDGKVDLPAVGFAIGDVVIRNLIEDTPHASAKMKAALDSETACDVFIVVADPHQQGQALALATRLRAEGVAVSYSLAAAKFNKQFKAAQQSKAPLALVIGNEFPEMSLKVLTTREEVKLTADDTIVETISKYLNQ
jgi:histidyl-tRNA synthetase